MAAKAKELTTLDPAVGQRQVAYALGLLMICGCVLTLPLFRAHVAGFPAFMLLADTAYALLAALAAALLLTRFALLRAASLLLLGCGFLFVTLTALPQLARAAHGLLPDPRLAFVAQLALAIAVIGYALRARAPADTVARSVGAGAQLAGAVAATVGIAALAAWLTPVPDAAAAGWGGSSRAWAALCLGGAEGLAIALLWRRRGATLELWLLVALTAWIVEALLQAMSRDATGIAWQVARLYALLGAACVTMALLVEVIHWARRGGFGGARAFAPGNDAGMGGSAALESITEQLSQPLCAITANVDAIERLLDRQPPDVAEVRAALGDLARDTQRASDTLRRAQRLAAEPPEPPAEIDVVELLDECVGQMRAEMQLHRVTCEVKASGELPGVRGMRKQLLQLLVNLVRNALETMSGPQRRERRLQVCASRHEARAIAIWVEGPGDYSQARELPRPFDPYFATVCRAIVYAHGGHISVTPGASGGTSFRVVLPVSS